MRDVVTLRPAINPCRSCPYRRDVPAGIWDFDEYVKLPPYDGETWEQPTELFQCHQYPAGDSQARLCAGWVACHDVDHLMALRIAGVFGRMADDELKATYAYSTTVPIFGSGTEAATHGMSGIVDPSPEARRFMTKISARRRRQRRDAR